MTSGTRLLMFVCVLALAASMAHAQNEVQPTEQRAPAALPGATTAAASPAEPTFNPSVFISPPWKRIWILTLATMLPAFLMVAVPFVISALAWTFSGVVTLVVAATQGWRLQGPALPWVLFPMLLATAVSGVAILTAPVGYVLARALAPSITRVASDGKESAVGTRHVIRFHVWDVGLHMGSAVVACGGGVVLGGVSAVALALGALVAPYSVCFPFCLPIAVVSPRNAGQGYAFLSLTAAPVLMIMFALGLLGGGLVATNVASPWLALQQSPTAQKEAKRAPDSNQDMELDDNTDSTELWPP